MCVFSLSPQRASAALGSVCAARLGEIRPDALPEETRCLDGASDGRIEKEKDVQ